MNQTPTMNQKEKGGLEKGFLHKLGDGDAKIQKLKKAAEEKLNSYSIDEKFLKNIEKTTLIKLVLIFSGHESIDIDEI